MPVHFATPVAHQTHADYAAFNGALARGRPFGQPLATAPDAANFAPGLELFLGSAGDVDRIYAMVDGSLTWQLGGVAGAPHRLTLTPIPPPANDRGYRHAERAIPRHAFRSGEEFWRDKHLEAPPASIGYENVDRTALESSLQAVLLAAHAEARRLRRNERQWHPAMVEAGPRGARSLKAHLDASMPGGNQPPAAEVQAIVTAFLNATAANLFANGFPVRAGDGLGRAAAYLATDPRPAPEPFPLGAPGDAARARRLTISTVDNCEQAVDPVYYLHGMLHDYADSRATAAARRPVESSTNLLVGAVLTHPLVTAIPAIGAAAAPAARRQVAGATRFAIGDLGAFHGFPPRAPISALEWRYTDGNHLEVQARIARTPVPRHLPTAAESAERDQVRAWWSTHGAAIAAIAEQLQVPSALIIAMLAAESMGRERAVRLEPLKSEHRRRLALVLQRTYDRTIGAHGTVANFALNGDGTASCDVTFDRAQRFPANALRGESVTFGNQVVVVRANAAAAPATPRVQRITLAPGTVAATDVWVPRSFGDLTVDVPWNGAALVGAGPMIWDQLADVVAATGGGSVSVGAVQTLIDTAVELRPWLLATAPGLFPATAPEPPAAAVEYLRDPRNAGSRGYLATMVNSLLLGAAYLRHHGYVQRSTGFDHPLAGAAYNANRLRQDANNAWGVHHEGHWVSRSAPYYNATVQLANQEFGEAALVPPPAVRFMR